jgi:hypothetical protein
LENAQLTLLPRSDSLGGIPRKLLLTIWEFDKAYLVHRLMKTFITFLART